jgi:hypothetical protein
LTCRTRPFRKRGPCFPDESRPRDLGSIVERYIRNHREGALAELAEFQNQPTFRDCITQAGLARRSDGRRLDHQRRIRPEALRAFAHLLTRKEKAIRSCRTFEELHSLIDAESQKLWKSAELTVYDTALRIGVYLKIEPTEVYLHRGTREGARALGFDGDRRSIRPDELRREFRRLRPREIEDCLCIYKADLKRLHLDRR